MEFEGRKRIRMHLDIAPLIDIVFLLLIFFMLTANFMVQPGIKITLPAARTSRFQEEQKIVIFISEDNKVFLNEIEVNINELKTILQSEIEEVDRKIVVLRADEKINLGLAVKVMDIAKQANVEGLVISTQMKDKLSDKSQYK